MSFKEITNCVQRHEILEDRAGIEIRGLMVSVDDNSDDDGEYPISIMAEIIATSGSTIDNDIEININCYNSNGQVCGTVSAYLESDSFFGLETLNEAIYSRGFPVEIKIIPKIRK